MKIAAFFLLGAAAFAQNRFLPGVQPFLTVSAPVIAITHVRVIDGTGAAPAADQTVVIDHGKIAAVGPAASVAVPAGAQTINGAGQTVIPGLVGMHEHLFYPAGGGAPLYNEMAFTFPRLYLASGVTTAHGGQPRAIFRSQREAPHRRGPHARAAHVHYRALSRRQRDVRGADA